MNLFINETHIFLTSQEEELPKVPYSFVWDSKEGIDLDIQTLSGEVFLKQPSQEDVRRLVNWVIEQGLPGARTIHILVKRLKLTKKYMMEGFKIIKAAGGLVTKDDKILMIYRLKRWDLPKGKVEKGEKRKEAAVREVEEECSVKVALMDKLATTWHHYSHDGRHILKQTKWYRMKCLDDQHMAPQTEEGIEDIRWMHKHEVQEIFPNTYSTIRYVIRAFDRSF